MKKSLDRKLCQKFPHLYRDRDEDMTKTCLCWGFPGNGWYRIIYRLSEQIQKHISKWPKEHYEAFRVCQVKEKFGTLRFYVDGADDTINRYISAAERKSARTCEQCGKPGKLQGAGWVVCICRRCSKHHLRRKLASIAKYSKET